MLVCLAIAIVVGRELPRRCILLTNRKCLYLILLIVFTIVFLSCMYCRAKIHLSVSQIREQVLNDSDVFAVVELITLMLAAFEEEHHYL